MSAADHMRFYEEWVWTPEFGEHAEKGPSKAAMYLRCAGSLNAERGLPDNAGYEAAEGTVFHEYAEMALKFGLEPHDFVIGTPMTVEAGGTLYTIEYDADMVRHMYRGLDFVRGIMALDPDAKLYVEQKVNLVPWLGPKQFGTTDVCIVLPNLRKIVIFDWKYGGIPVYPVENEQAQLYCLGSWVSYAGKHFDMDPHGIEVHIHIEQPRAPGAGGDWITTMTDVLKFGEDVKIKAALTDDPDAPRTAGEKQCRFCKAKRKCSTYITHKLDLFGMMMEDVDTGFENGTPPKMPDVNQLTPERLSYIYLNKASFIKFLEEVHDHILTEHDRGQPTPMLKVVDGRGGARKFRGSDLRKVKAKLVGRLGKQAYIPQKLVSPAQAEALMGRKEFREAYAAHCIADPPGRSLVPIEDGRDARRSIPDQITEDDLI